MEGEIQEVLSDRRSVTRYLRSRIFRRTDLENSLHLGELHPRMLTSEHFDDEATKRPNVCLSGVACLLDHFRRHPEDRPLQRRPMYSGGSTQKICKELSEIVCSDLHMYLLSSTFFEIPKSEILIPPRLSTGNTLISRMYWNIYKDLLSPRMFAPLISLWIISFSCKYAKPLRICLTKVRTKGSSKEP